MSTRSFGMNERLHAYLLDSVLREPPILAELRRETQGLKFAGMQLSPECGQFLGLLVELLGARRYLEIGTFTGYSSLCVALSLPQNGQVVALDSSAEWTAVAQRYWQRAGAASRITLRLGEALQSLDAMLKSGEGDRFDLALIDADKAGYDAYYERCLRLVRPGGIIALDNMLWGGSVADPQKQDEDTEAIRKLNRKIRDDLRVTASLVPIGDGLMLCRRRA